MIAKDNIYFITITVPSLCTKIIHPIWRRGGEVRRVQHAEIQMEDEDRRSATTKQLQQVSTATRITS